MASKRLERHADTLFVAMFALTLVVGIWHALPNTSVVGDESLYVGGTLRALEAHTLVPQIDNAYTVSFYLNYLAMVPVVGVVIAMTGSIAGATSWLYAHYALLYLVPRAVTLGASIGIALIFLRLSRLEGHAAKQRILAAMLILTPILTTTVMHTGKMWTVSCFFILLANYCALYAVRHPGHYAWYRSPLWWSIGAAGLAVTNFPFAIIAMVAPAWMAWQYRRNHAALTEIGRAVVVWGIACGGLSLLNLHGWIVQNMATPTYGQFIPLTTLGFEAVVLCATFPLLLIAALSHVRAIQDKPLAGIALVEAGLFLVLVALRAPWTAGSLDFLRYAFLPGLLLGCVLVATPLHHRRLLLLLAGISLVFFVKTLYVLAVPTTYNQTYDWVVSILGTQRVLIYNEVPNLDLPKNSAASQITLDTLCASRCQYLRTHDAGPRFVVVDASTDRSRLPSDSTGIYRVFAGTEEYYSINHALGLYAPAFLLVPRLGETLYVYKQ